MSQVYSDDRSHNRFHIVTMNNSSKVGKNIFPIKVKQITNTFINIHM